METCKKNKKPKVVRLYLKHKIISKYERIIDKTIERMKDKSMGELWCELDKLKLEMSKEFKQAGIPLES